MLLIHAPLLKYDVLTLRVEMLLAKPERHPASPRIRSVEASNHRLA
jgi:hypothetical protein